MGDRLKEDYQCVTAQCFFAARCLQQAIVAEQVETGRNIYGKKRRVDFILYHPLKWQDCLVIQCKWQASTGSVEEKFPFEVACIKHGCFPTIVILDGGGYSNGARDWLMAQCGDQLVDVLDEDGLVQWQAKGRI